MKIKRTVFKKEIISEFLPPSRKVEKVKVIILCTGMPSSPGKNELLEFLSKKGFWVFLPRYRGSWESHGKFLKKSPHEDILDIVDQLPRGFKDSQTEKTIKLKPSKIFLVGSSFGGPAAILASKDKRVDKVVCLSPVIDWREEKWTEEPMDYLEKFVKTYFGKAYDFDAKDWRKLGKGNFYNPIDEAENIDGNKIFIVHAKDDRLVSFKPLLKFVKETNCAFKLLNKGGHLGSSFLMNRKLPKQVFKFFK